MINFGLDKKGEKIIEVAHLLDFYTMEQLPEAFQPQ